MSQLSLQLWLGAFLLSLALAGCKRSHPAGEPVLRVDSVQMTAQEFAQALAEKLKSFDALAIKEPTTLTRAKDAVIEDFLVYAATQKWAQGQQINITDPQIDQEVARIRAQYPDDISFRGEQLQTGRPYGSWRQRVQQRLLQERLFTFLRQQIKAPTEAELREYFATQPARGQRPAQVRLRQVVVDKQERAEQLLKKIRAGASIAELARQYSLAPERNRDGDTGWIDVGTLTLFDHAYKMKVGERSGIYRSAYGYHIFEVLAKRPAQNLTLATGKELLTKELLEEKERSAYQKWLEEQLRRYKVLKNDQMIAALTAELR